jgi:serine/threonine protein phosphatase PrpC
LKRVAVSNQFELAWSSSDFAVLITGGKYEGPVSGCTAVVAVIIGKDLYVANAGDSRCVLAYGDLTQPLTVDHKPTNEAEYNRIHQAGGYVQDGRVNASLGLSRAIGDLKYKEVCFS